MRPSHPALNVRDDAYAPLAEAGRSENASDLAENESKLFLQSGLDDPNQAEIARRIRF
jgi:hypothetical protein